MTDKLLQEKQNPTSNVQKCAIGVNGIIEKMFDESAGKSVRLYRPRHTYQPRPVPKHLLDLIDTVLNGKTTNSIRHWHIPQPIHQTAFPQKLEHFITDLFRDKK